jgi:hypothetical protein
MLIPYIASQTPNLAGLIVLAGPSRPLEDLYLEQMTYIVGLDGDVSGQEQEALARIEQQAARVKNPQLSVDTPQVTCPAPSLRTSPAGSAGISDRSPDRPSFPPSAAYRLRYGDR